MLKSKAIHKITNNKNNKNKNNRIKNKSSKKKIRKIHILLVNLHCTKIFLISWKLLITFKMEKILNFKNLIINKTILTIMNKSQMLPHL